MPDGAVGVLGGERLGAGDRHEVAVDATQRLRRDLEVQVGAVQLDEPSQGTVKIEGHIRVIGHPSIG